MIVILNIATSATHRRALSQCEKIVLRWSQFNLTIQSGSTHTRIQKNNTVATTLHEPSQFKAKRAIDVSVG